MHRVCIGKQQPLPSRVLRSKPAGIRLAGEGSLRIGQRRSLEHADALVLGRRLLRNCTGAVRRVVVDDNQLPIRTQRKQTRILHQQAFETHWKIPLLVARRNNHAQLEADLFAHRGARRLSRRQRRGLRWLVINGKAKNWAKLWLGGVGPVGHRFVL